MFDNFIEQLKNRLLLPLPGEATQFLMAPPNRQPYPSLFSNAVKPIKSAVLILLFPKNNDIHTILIERTTYKGVHSAQIAFPGGKYEISDIDLAQTALRETHEEIGISPNQINIIGKITDVYITPSNYLVSPYIAFTNELVQYVINRKEVNNVIETELFKLNKPTVKSEKLIKHSNGEKIKTQYYDVKGFTTWGATAMMISELNVIVEESSIISF
jgi:8-oxo-dGTP pyrophosphatase MutT (NUDIX family)